MEDHFTAYEGLVSDLGDARWAFGTGFVDPLAGIDTAVPDGIDPDALADYCLALGDDALIYSHRLQEWVSRAPELEEETALANIALDLLGQARMLLTRAARATGTEDEDQLAFFRTEQQFRNVRLVERKDQDFAELVTRLLIFATWRLALFEQLRNSKDPVLAAIAEKGSKELAYHRDYAAQWAVRLGDGTELSHAKTQNALELIWRYVEELFDTADTLDGVAVDPASVRDEVDVVLDTVLATATLERPDRRPVGKVSGRAGRQGAHTEALGYVLAEMQSVARQHPDARW